MIDFSHYFEFNTGSMARQIEFCNVYANFLRKEMNAKSLMRRNFKVDYLPQGARPIYDASSRYSMYSNRRGIDQIYQRQVFERPPRSVTVEIFEIHNYFDINLRLIREKNNTEIHNIIEKNCINFLELENNIFRELIYMNLDKVIKKNRSIANFDDISNTYAIDNDEAYDVVLIKNDCDWKLHFPEKRVSIDPMLQKNEVLLIRRLYSSNVLAHALMPVDTDITCVMAAESNEEIKYDVFEQIGAVIFDEYEEFEIEKYQLFGKRKFENKKEFMWR